MDDTDSRGIDGVVVVETNENCRCRDDGRRRPCNNGDGRRRLFNVLQYPDIQIGERDWLPMMVPPNRGCCSIGTTTASDASRVFVYRRVVPRRARSIDDNYCCYRRRFFYLAVFFEIFRRVSRDLVPMDPPW